MPVSIKTYLYNDTTVLVFNLETSSEVINVCLHQHCQQNAVQWILLLCQI